MDSKIIDGNALAKKHEEILKKKLESLKRYRNPAVVSFCNQDDPPSVKYTFMKLQKAQDLGIDFIAEEFSSDTPKDYLENLVKNYGSDGNVDGILVQLPLPQELNPFKEDLLSLIPPEKDVDGLVDGSPFLPATVKAVISILNEYISGWQKKKIAIVGSEGEIGKSLGAKLIHPPGVSLTTVDKNTGSLETDLKDADIIISAVGSENLIRAEMIREGAVLIDVGLGDFDPDCFQKASLYTSKIGGVGPMTVISLMENVTEAFLRKLKSS